MDAQKELGNAFKDYQKDISELKTLSGRLLGNLRAAKNNATLQTVQAQLKKVETGFSDAEKKFNSRLDAINASMVTQIRGLGSFAAAQGAGTAFLLSECDDFAGATGFKERQRIFDGICSTLEVVADALVNSPTDAVITTRCDSERPVAEWHLKHSFLK